MAVYDNAVEYCNESIVDNEATLESLSDVNKYSTWVTGLATGGIGIVGLRVVFNSQHQLLPQMVSWVVLVLSALLLLASLLMGHYLIKNNIKWGRTTRGIIRGYRIAKLDLQSVILPGETIESVRKKIDDGDYLDTPSMMDFKSQVGNEKAMSRCFKWQSVLVLSAIILTVVVSVPSVPGFEKADDESKCNSKSSEVHVIYVYPRCEGRVI